MADYTPEIRSAYADIKAAGLPITLSMEVEGDVPVDVDKPWLGNTPATLEVATHGLFVQLEKFEIDGTRVLATDRAMLIPGLDNVGESISVINPQVQIIANEVTYQVLRVLKVVAPNSQNVLHRVALR